MVGIGELTFLFKVRSFFAKLLTSPYFYAALAFIAIACGTFYYLRTDKAQAVEEAATTATAAANTNATLQTRETEAAVNRSFAIIDTQTARKREQTIKDYEYVRGRIEAAPQEQREAPVPPLIVDTLNELDRLRGLREPGTAATGVPDPDLPAG